MKAVREDDLPQMEDAGRKVWCDPTLVEYDVETVTAGGGGPIDDGLLTS